MESQTLLRKGSRNRATVDARHFEPLDIPRQIQGLHELHWQLFLAVELSKFIFLQNTTSQMRSNKISLSQDRTCPLHIFSDEEFLNMGGESNSISQHTLWDP